MTHETEKDGLDALFAQARTDAPSPALMARVLADAERVQSETSAPPPVPRAPWWVGVISAIGGWSAVSGVATAGVMGLAVGLYAPDAVSGVLAGDTLSFGSESFELTPDLSALWTEDGDV